MSIPTFRCHLLALLLTVLGFSNNPARTAEPPEFAEIRGGWKRLQEMDESGRSYRLTRTEKTATGKVAIPDSISDIRAGRSLLRIHSRRKNTGEAIIAQNPNYCFILSKQQGQEGRGWSLGKFSEEKVEEKNPVLYMVTDYGIFQRFPLSAVLTCSPAEFMKLPGLEILATEPISPNRHKVKFRIKGNPDGKSTRWLNGEMTTDPTRHHCVTESFVDQGVGRRFLASRVVAEQDGQLVCTSATLNVPSPVDLDNKNPDIYSFSYENIRVNDPVPAEECYLSHYGLPEPVDVKAPQPTRSWWPYMLAAAVLCVLIATYAWYRSRRAPRDATKT